MLFLIAKKGGLFFPSKSNRNDSVEKMRQKTHKTSNLFCRACPDGKVMGVRETRIRGLIYSDLPVYMEGKARG